MTVMEMMKFLEAMLHTGQVNPDAELIIYDYEYDEYRIALGVLKRDEDTVEISW